MEKIIRDLIEDVPYNVKLIIKGAAANHFLLAKDIDDVFSSASLIKVPILFTVLDYLEKKNESIHQIVKVSPENLVDFSVLTELQVEECTLHDLLVWMIITSDNSATNVLIDFIGFENLNQYFKNIGLLETSIQRKMMDFVQLQKGYDNRTTARDMAKLYTAIYRKELLSPKYSELAIDILSRQRILTSLKRYLVEDVKIAHKTGSLDAVEHDVGIVYTNKIDYLIGVFITNHHDNENAKQLIGKVSKIVYDHLVKEGIDSL